MKTGSRQLQSRVYSMHRQISEESRIKNIELAPYTDNIVSVVALDLINM